MAVLGSALILFNEDDKVEQFRWSLTRAIDSLSEDEKGRVSKRLVLNIIRDLGGFYE